MKLWGGRFAGGTHPLLEEFGRSLESDSRLAVLDVRTCQAHVQMLGEVGAIPSSTVLPLLEALKGLQGELEEGKIKPEGAHEDVHSWVEAELKTRVGDSSSYIRLGRSRNDLVVTDFRLWCMEACTRLQKGVRALQSALLEQAKAHQATILPGYTHLQRAQPVSLAHHLLAHFWSCERDHRRFDRCREEADCCPLGAGALAGSSWSVNPSRTAELLGFSQAFVNSLDAVSDRDFAAELLSGASLCMIHLSRMAEEIILWTSQECAFASLADEWATGSSLMPQKKNPDPAELIRGRTGRIVGHLMSLLMTMKGLPLAYNRDLQEDKPPVFEAVEMLEKSLFVMAGVITGMTFDVARMREAAGDPGLLATDLADALVRSGQPFSVAHELAGKWVAQRLDAAEQALVAPLLEGLTPESVLAARSHPGAAGPQSVTAQLTRAASLLSTGA